MAGRLSDTFRAEMIIGQGILDREVSWWPQLHRWNTSNIHVLYWSSYCESWFRIRQEGQKQSDNRYIVRSASEWSQALKMYKETDKLVKNNERNSLQFLQSIYR